MEAYTNCSYSRRKVILLEDGCVYAGSELQQTETRVGAGRGNAERRTIIDQVRQVSDVICEKLISAPAYVLTPLLHHRAGTLGPGG